MKNSGFTDFVFKGTYYYANMVANILEYPYDYIRSISEFWGDEKQLLLNFMPFQKYSIFHAFIYFIIESTWRDEISDSQLKKFKENYKSYQLSSSSFAKEPFLTSVEYYAHCYKFDVSHPWITEGKTVQELTSDDIDMYYQDLPLWRDDYEDLIKFMANEVFNILFTNRVLMANFNGLLANVISSSIMNDISADYKHLFEKDGVLKRKRIPEWAKRAIKFRDHGYCVQCHKDISEEQRNISEVHVDHIVPLAKGGLNDISNLQLLCEHCNTRKGAREVFTNNSAIDWYK